MDTAGSCILWQRDPRKETTPPHTRQCCLGESRSRWATNIQTIEENDNAALVSGLVLEVRNQHPNKNLFFDFVKGEIAARLPHEISGFDELFSQALSTKHEAAPKPPLLPPKSS